MTEKFSFVFPGQGSQSVGMMNAYGDMPMIRHTFEEASQVIGRDLWQLVTEGPVEAINQTVNTQPVMLTAGIAVYRAWRERMGEEPALLAGHSLGEYSALVVAGVLDFQDAVMLVQCRAEAMQTAVPKGQGAMAAILGLDDETVCAVCAQAAQNGQRGQSGQTGQVSEFASEVVEAVNFNTPGQVVIAGHVAAVERAISLAKSSGAKRAVLLPVSAPFHCSLMQPAADRMREHLAGLTLNTPRIPVIQNAEAMVFSEPEAIKAALVRQVASPVRWVETMVAMANHGICTVYECGPGRVLAGLVKRCDSRLTTAIALADQKTFEGALLPAITLPVT